MSNIKAHVLSHSHGNGVERYLFSPPKGFETPYGLFDQFGEDEAEYPALIALLSFLEVNFEPEKGEVVEVFEMDEPVEEPTLRELQKLMPVETDGA